MKFLFALLLLATASLSTTSAETPPPPVPEATYEEVRDLPNHPEILLVDVREASELIETGRIPTSINVPRKNFAFISFIIEQTQTHDRVMWLIASSRRYHRDDLLRPDDARRVPAFVRSIEARTR